MSVSATGTTVHYDESGRLPRSFDDLFNRGKPQRVAPNAVLFREGEIPNGVYILHWGEVALTHVTTDGMRRERTARAGEILGLAAVISDCAHLTTAIATTRCEFGFIEREEFQSAVDASPAIWFSVLRQLSQDVNASYDLIRNRDVKGPM